MILCVIVFMLIVSVCYGSLGIGYTVNLPDEWAGIGGFWLRDGFGVFMMATTDLQARATMNLSHRLVNSWGDAQQQVIKTSGGGLFGLTYPLYSGIYVYLGAGNRMTQHYHQYYDRYEILGDRGYYWLKGDSESEMRYAGGIIALQSKLMMVLGVSGKPIRVTGGLGGIF
jgi:hypothetical protein